MTEPKTAEEWGRLAVSLPGWRWLPGMLAAGPTGPKGGRKRAIVTGTLAEDGAPRAVDYRGRRVPASYAIQCESFEVSIDPDDPATAGCLLAMLGPGEWDNVAPGSAVEPDGEGWWAWIDGKWSEGLSLGRACISAAAALGRWPGGS